jgi:hypothetical protein
MASNLAAGDFIADSNQSAQLQVMSLQTANDSAQLQVMSLQTATNQLSCR